MQSLLSQLPVPPTRHQGIIYKHGPLRGASHEKDGGGDSDLKGAHTHVLRACGGGVLGTQGRIRGRATCLEGSSLDPFQAPSCCGMGVGTAPLRSLAFRGLLTYDNMPATWIVLCVKAEAREERLSSSWGWQELEIIESC